MPTYLRKYFIMGSQNCHRDPRDILQEAIEAGITAFQYREKGEGALTGKDKLNLGKDLRKICLNNNIPFFINDDSALIDVLNVDGIHVGQADLPVEILREKYPNLLIGLSISNKKELNNSRLELVDYIGAGPIYNTETKIDAKEAVGTKWIEHLRKHYPNLPIVGIGGITTQNVKNVLYAGANGVAVISVITCAKDIKKVVEQL